MNRYEAVKRLRHWHHDADDIRFEGKCPSCRRYTLYSYVLPGDKVRRTMTGHDPSRENCGFFCASCNWGNAGSRENWDAEPTASETNKIVSVRYRP